jgi:hypothetical protein
MFQKFRKQKTELTENGNFLLFSVNENFRLFTANGNGKRKFVFLGQQTINCNGPLLFQQRRPTISMSMGCPLYVTNW